MHIRTCSLVHHLQCTLGEGGITGHDMKDVGVARIGLNCKHQHAWETLILTFKVFRQFRPKSSQSPLHLQTPGHDDSQDMWERAGTERLE
jgi:hypothetical protein